MTTTANEGHTQEAAVGPSRPKTTQLPHVLRYTARFVALLLVAAALAAAMAQEPLARSAELMVQTGAATLGAWAALVTEGLGARGPTVRAALLWSLLAAAATAGLAIAGGFDFAAAAVAVGAFVLVSCFGLLLVLARAGTGDAFAAGMLLVTAAALCVCAPLWLGPVAESFAERGALVNTIVALSPLSYLAALADFDYLRATWFYEHSALGALRYEYPSVWLQSVLYTLPLAATAALRLRAKTSNSFARSY